jgi:hypothetical protein
MAGNRGRSGAVTAIAGARRSLGGAVDAFLSVPRPDTTARTYAGPVTAGGREMAGVPAPPERCSAIR